MSTPLAPLLAPASPRAPAVPWYVTTALLAATSSVVGVLWDISWHRSIGRDTFWTPAHIAIYLGGVLAGGACGWLVLRTTFAGSTEERARGVTFWGFRGPLGAWVSIWGAIAMITSAPFDNWWHNAYGLDVKIISPPHVLLALGFTGIELGALLLVVAWQNRSEGATARTGGLLYAYAAGLMLVNAATMGMEYIGFGNEAHTALYYEIAGAGFPLYLAAFGRSARLRWPATAAATGYMAVTLVMIWVLQLFPATPKLAPVFNPLTTMVPPPFPLLLVVPALGVDLVMRQLGPGRDWWLSVPVGLTFLALFGVTQWLFSEFLISPAARTFFFGVDQWDYSTHVGRWRYTFWGLDNDPLTLRALLIAALLAMVSARLGLGWGKWMTRVRR
jgi:hypothetical protein